MLRLGTRRFARRGFRPQRGCASLDSRRRRGRPYYPSENAVDPLCDACAACPIDKLLATIKVLIEIGKVNGSLSKTEAGWTPLMLKDRPNDFEGVDENAARPSLITG